MNIQEMLRDVLSEQCGDIHSCRLNAVLDVAEGLRQSQNLSIAAIGRKLSGEAKVKHKIKKVDRCLGNKNLHKELGELYKGLSYFIFQHVKNLKEDCIVIDLCYLKDDRVIQMLSAQLCTRGMSLPLYQEVFCEGELKGRTESFLSNLKSIIPDNKKVMIIMDAGFHVEWFKVIESYGWAWICRVRRGKSIKVNDTWISVEDYIPTVGPITKDQGNILFTERHKYSCRLVTTRKAPKGRKQKISRNKTSTKFASGSYSTAAKEPWMLITNVSNESCRAVEIVEFYAKRMQIEETFRAIKSHQFGLSARYVQTLDVNRWAVLMLLSSIILITYWIIGVIGHHNGMQKLFQVNTSHERQFSYFTLGRLIIEHQELHKIPPSLLTLSDIIMIELKNA